LASTSTTGPLQSPITRDTLFGGGGAYGSFRFLHGEDTKAASTLVSTNVVTTAVSTNSSLVVQPDIGGSQNIAFNQGGKLDLTQVLAGAPLAHDLTNIGNFIKVLGHGKNDPGFGQGTKTTLEITGPGGSAVVNLESSGKVDLKDLLKHDSLILPPH
jgi:hypothetical protein